MKYGLSDKVIERIQKVFESCTAIDKVILFGSRAKGNFKEGSDIDLAVKGRDYTFDTERKVSMQLDDLNLPYEIDLVNYHTIKEPALTAHIDRVGIDLYSRWKEYKLEEITEPLKETFNPDGSDDYSYIGLEHIEQESLRLNSVGVSSDVTSNKFLFKANDILFGKLRPYFRKVVKPQFDGICSTDIWVFRAKKGFDQDYLFYFIANWDFVNTANSGEGGTRMPRADWNFLKTTEWSLPPLPEQKSIASTLSSLDDKIDLLQRQNKTLEQLAETLFRQWFVEEAGWHGSLSEYVKVQGGYAFKSKDFKPTGFAGIIKITNISMGIIDIKNSDFVDESIVKYLDNRFKIKSGDFLIAMTGAEIGKIGIVEKTEKEIWVNQRVGKLEAKVPYGNIIGYLALKSREGQDHIVNACAGSAQENISTTGIEEMKFASYDSEKSNSFGQQAQPFFDKIIFNLNQINTLSKLRDTLLPKLMSGEIRLN
ncbi:MAG: restriction endonuclease subunit S [Bacteroidetes bacterium]|nr:restriction endonuclease subunit S [Bacteroidota bacterium]